MFSHPAFLEVLVEGNVVFVWNLLKDQLSVSVDVSVFKINLNDVHATCIQGASQTTEKAVDFDWITVAESLDERLKFYFGWENVKRTEGTFEFLGTEVALAGQVSSVQEDSQGSEADATFFLKVHLDLRVDAVALNI